MAQPDEIGDEIGGLGGKAALTLTLTLHQSTRMLRVLVTGYANDIGLLTGTRCGRDAFRNNELIGP